MHTWSRNRKEQSILVVDNDEVLLYFLHDALQQHGFISWMARNGRQALHLFRQQPDLIDLVLLGVRMSGMDGPKTLRKLRAVRPAVPCCFMNESSGRYSEKELLDLGALRVFSKPFALHPTIQELEVIFEQHRHKESLENMAR